MSDGPFPQVDQQASPAVDSSQTIPTPQSTQLIDTIAQPPPQPTAQTPAEQRARDQQGRFVGQTPEAPAAAPPPPPAPKFSQNLVELAKSVFYTDEQIDKFHDPALLFDAVQGRAASLGYGRAQQGQQPAQPVQQPAVPAAPSVDPFADFDLKIDDGFDQELARPVKELTQHVNEVVKRLVAKVATVEARNEKLESAMQQSAGTAQQISQQQQAVMWDGLVSSVPGMLEVVGKPSQALGRPGSPEAQQWAKVAPWISAAIQGQNVPEQFVDLNRAIREGWAAYQATRNGSNGNNGNGQHTGTNGLPGVAARSAPRTSSVAPTNGSLSPRDDYARRLAVMENAWNQNDGNPFKI